MGGVWGSLQVQQGPSEGGKQGIGRGWAGRAEQKESRQEASAGGRVSPRDEAALATVTGVEMERRVAQGSVLEQKPVFLLLDHLWKGAGQRAELLTNIGNIEWISHLLLQNKLPKNVVMKTTHGCCPPVSGA